MKKTILGSGTVVALSTIAFFGCSNEVDSPVEAIDFEPIELSAQESSVCADLTEFSFKFFKEAYSESAKKGIEKGVVVSPLSAAMTIGMAGNAVAEDKKNVMMKWLNLPDGSVNSLNSLAKVFNSRLPKIDNTSKLKLANSIWNDASNAPKLDYRAAMSEFYFADFLTVDVTSANFVNQVNSWCKEKTSGMIDNFLSNPLSSKNDILWLNALYFEGKWSSPFYVENTKTGKFTNINGVAQNVKMMHNERATYKGGRSSNYSFVTLHYGNWAYNFTAILPDEGVTFNEFVNNLNVADWQEMLGAEPRGEISVSLPRFEQQSLSDIGELMNADPDFSTSCPIEINQFGSDKPSYLSAILQGVVIKIDEAGTKAAAVTGSVTDGCLQIIDSIEFNRPFVYVIHELSTGAILFMGAVTGF